MSTCGRLLATAGQDNIVRVWVVKGAVEHFEKLRADAGRKTPPPSSGMWEGDFSKSSHGPVFRMIRCVRFGNHLAHVAVRAVVCVWVRTFLQKTFSL